MPIRHFEPNDARPLAELSVACQRGESDFVLNPLWASEAELQAEFARRGTEPDEHLLVAESEDGAVIGMAGMLGDADGDAGMAGMLCPIVPRGERGHGVGGELLRASLSLAGKRGVKLLTAGIGTRNRSGYSLLTAHGFRPVRQHFLMRCAESPAAPEAPDGFSLEAAKAGDLEAILGIYDESGFEPRTLARMQKLFEDGRHVHGVARDADGGLAAFVEIETHWPSRPWVAYVGVTASCRGRGLGSQLVAWVLARCFQEGAAAALLMLSPSNREAMRAYEKVGFKRFRVIDVLERAV